MGNAARDDRGSGRQRRARPIPDDPIAAAAGFLQGRIPPTEEIRARAREDERFAIERRELGSSQPSTPTRLSSIADQAAGQDVEEIMRTECVMSSVNLAESLDVLERVYGVEEDEPRARLDPLLSDVIAIELPSVPDAWSAARLRSKHYERSTRASSIADCFLLAMGARLGVAVATADPAIAAREESIELVALPDRSGDRP